MGRHPVVTIAARPRVCSGTGTSRDSGTCAGPFERRSSCDRDQLDAGLRDAGGKEVFEPFPAVNPRLGHRVALTERQHVRRCRPPLARVGGRMVARASSSRIAAWSTSQARARAAGGRRSRNSYCRSRCSSARPSGTVGRLGPGGRDGVRYRDPRSGELVTVEQAVRVSGADEWAPRRGPAEILCWGVLRSGLLWHPGLLRVAQL